VDDCLDLPSDDDDDNYLIPSPDKQQTKAGNCHHYSF